ncbi:MAG: diacylglycerol/lipid kinase family protein [Planctomycetota bacterium]
MQRFRIICNPVSGTHDRTPIINGVAEGLRARGHVVEITPTQCAGDAVRLAREAPPETGVVVAVGGDGTITEAAEGLRQRGSGGGGGRETALGIVAAGTANVLAKELGFPWDVPSLVNVLDAGKIRRFDGGVCNGERFMLMIGAGLDGAVAHAHTRGASGRNNYLRYVKPVVDIIVRMPLHPLHVTVDGAPMPPGITSVIVANFRGFGGVFEACSNADPTDGWFDVIGLTTRSRALWTAFLFAALQRRLHEMPGTYATRGRQVTITTSESASKIPRQRDGDPFGFITPGTPTQISLEPGAVPIIVP